VGCRFRGRRLNTIVVAAIAVVVIAAADIIVAALVLDGKLAFLLVFGDFLVFGVLLSPSPIS